MGKPGNRNSTKQIAHTGLGGEEIKLLQDIAFNEAFDEWPAEYTRQFESHPGADGQADGGENKADGLAVDKAAGDPSKLPRKRCGDHLEDLQHHEDRRRIGAQLLEKLAELIAAGIDALEIVELGAGRRESAKRPRNVAAEKKQQQHEADEDDPAYDEPAALIAHPALYSNYCFQRREPRCAGHVVIGAIRLAWFGRGCYKIV